MTRIAGLALGLLVLWPFGSVAQQRSLPADAPETVAEVVRDRDGDFVPDRLGERVRVGGRALVASNQLRQGFTLYLESGGAGMGLTGVLDAAVAAGDSLVVEGTVQQRDGARFVEATSYRVVPGARVLPAPVPYHPATDDAERLEGRLVQVEGRVIGRSTFPAGKTLSLLVEGGQLTLVLYADRPDGATFDGVELGAQMRAVGVLGQFDRDAPFDGGYQVYPRSLSDLHAVGMSVRAWRLLAVALVLLVLLAALWAVSLRRQVRRRVAEQVAVEARYRVLFNNVDDAVIVSDALADEPIVLDVNEEMLRLTGYERHDLVGRSARAFVVAGPLAEQHREQIQQEGRARGRLDFLCKDGTHLPVEVRSQRLRLDAATLVVSTARDLRARLAHEQALEEARERAEGLAKLQASFVANMSHELRTPLAGMIGFADILHGELSGEHAEFAAIIAQGGQRLLDTLNAVLDLARLDAQGYELHAETVDARAVVRDAVTLLRPLMGRKDVALRLDLPEEPLLLVTDATALDRIVNNLVGNAIKFTHHGYVEVALHSERGGVLVRVTDTGVGMSEAFQQQLFAPFKQESDGLARRHEGVGLGLSISRRLAELLQGTIAVESQKNVGTTFTVWLPSLRPVAEVSGAACVQQPG